MKRLKKILVSAISLAVFTLCLSFHLTAVTGSEVYTVSSEDKRFSYCENSDGTVKIKASDDIKFENELVIPSTLDKKTVTGVSERGFVGQKLVKKIVLPDTVTSIGGSAFSSCTALENVTVKGTVTDIGWYPFYDTPYEDKLEKSSDFVIFNGDILYDYSGTDSSIQIPSGIRVISGHVFTYYENKRDFEINNVVFPDSVEYICSGAFYDCKNINGIILGSGIKNIGTDAFTVDKMTVTGYYETFAQSYAEGNGYDFEPLLPMGSVSETIYADFGKGFRQYYFTDEKDLSRDGVLVYRRNYNGEKLEIKDWEYSGTLADITSKSDN